MNRLIRTNKRIVGKAGEFGILVAMKTFFIVPGFKMQAKDRPFKWLVQFLEEKGIRVVKVPVAWNYKTLSQNAEDFVGFFNANKTEKNYILGFSYGAVIAFLTAQKLKPKKVYLCSLSPDFTEDRQSMGANEVKIIGKNRYDDTKKRSAKKLAGELSVPAVVFYGEKEGEKYPQLKKRCEEVVRLSKHSQLVVVKDSPHKIDFPDYIIAIKKSLG